MIVVKNDDNNNNENYTKKSRVNFLKEQLSGLFDPLTCGIDCYLSKFKLDVKIKYYNNV